MTEIKALIEDKWEKADKKVNLQNRFSLSNEGGECIFMKYTYGSGHRLEMCLYSDKLCLSHQH